MPGWRTRKVKALEAETKLTYWRNQEADRRKMHMEAGEVGVGLRS